MSDQLKINTPVLATKRRLRGTIERVADNPLRYYVRYRDESDVECAEWLYDYDITIADTVTA